MYIPSAQSAYQPNYWAVNSQQQQSSSGSSFAQVLDREQSALEPLSKSSAIENLFGFKPEKEGCVSLEEIELHATEYLKDFNAELNSLLNKNGIDVTKKIELGQDSSGNVVVKNDHPDKEAIEALFKDNPGLRDEFSRIHSMFELVQECKQALEFQKAYAIDPQKAVADFAYLFTTHVEGTMTIENGQATMSYEDKQDR